MKERLWRYLNKMVGAMDAYRIAKKTIDKTNDIEKSLKQMSQVSVSSANNSNPTKYSAVKTTNSFVNGIVYLLLFIIYFGVLFFNLDRILGLSNYFIELLPEFLFYPEFFVLSLVGLLFAFIPMEVLGVKDGKLELLGTLLKIVGVLFFFSFVLGYFFNGGVQPEDTDILVESANQKTFTIFDQIGCYMRDYKACVEKVKDTDTATQSDLSVYNIKLVKPVISNYKKLNEYNDDGLRVQYDIESSGDLVLKEFRCYHSLKKVENMFYSESLNLEIDEKNSGLKTFYCQNISQPMFDEKSGDLKINIYPMLIFELKSTITQQVPVLNLNKMSESEFEIESDNFVREYSSFVDTGSKFDVSSESFKKQMPVVLGDDESTDRSFTVVIKKKISSFGRFQSGEILDIRIPSSLSSRKEVSKYLGKIDLYDEIHGIDFNVFDNEEFGVNMNQKKIVQNLDIDYVSTFANSGLVEIRVNVPEVKKDSNGNVIESEEDKQINNNNEQEYISAVDGTGIVG